MSAIRAPYDRLGVRMISMRNHRIRILVLAGLLAASLACGKKGDPLPPEPRGPLPAGAVSARQVGRSVEVRFEIAGARGPKPAQQPVRAELIRVVATDPAAPTSPDAFRRVGEEITALEGDPLPIGVPLVLFDAGLTALPDAGEGLILRYAVRLRDRKERPSPSVVASDLAPLASSGPPLRINAEPTVDGMRLSWDPPESSTDAKYNVYRSEPGVSLLDTPLNEQPLGETDYLDDRVVTGAEYVYTVRVALSAERPYREGESSSGFQVLTEDRFAPAQPTGLVAVQEGMAVRLFWNPNRERDLAGYRLYRRVDSGDWVRIARDPLEQPLHLDREVEAGQLLDYRVTAIDRIDPPNEGPPSDAERILVATEPVRGGGSSR